MEKKFKQHLKLLFIAVVFSLHYQTLFSQICNCSFSGSATWTVSGNSSTNYSVGNNQKLYITSTGNYTGTITLSGSGAVYNLGTFSPSSSSTYTSGTIRNCGTINWNTTPFPDGSSNSIYIYNCENGIINFASGSNVYLQYILKNYGIINVADGHFITYGCLINYATGKIKQSGSARYFDVWGTLTNEGAIEVLGGFGYRNWGCASSSNNTGIITIDKDFFNLGTFYTECTVDIKRDFRNDSYIFGPTTYGRWGQFKVAGYSANYGRFNIRNEYGQLGYLDMCDDDHPPGGWDFTYAYFDYYVGYTTTYCQHEGTGCTHIPPYEVAINPVSPTVCTGSCATLSAVVTGGSGNYTYVWSNGLGTNSSINVCPTAATSYTVTVTDVTTGKVGSANTTVQVGTLPTVSISAPAGAICPGVSKNLTASGASTYTWLPANSVSPATGATVAATPTVTTTYTVTGTNAAGCTKQATYTVTVHPAPIANAGNDKFACPSQPAVIGGAPTASGGTTPYTYSWSPTTNLSSSTIANPSASPTVVREYTVTVTDFKACTSKDETVVTYYSTCCDVGAPALSLQSYLNKIVNKGPIPNNNCIVLNPPTDKEAWFSFAGDPTGGVIPTNNTYCDVVDLGQLNNYITVWKTSHTNILGNQYECTIKLAHLSSCYSSSSIKFLHSIAPHPTKNTGGGNAYAFTIKARLSNGTDVELEGESTCKQIALDCGCDKLKPGFVAKSNCKGVPVQFSNTSKGTVMGTTYLWKFGTGATSTLQNPTYTYATAGTYTVELTVNNNNGCSKIINHVVCIKDCSDCSGGDQMLAFQEYMTTIVSHQTLSSSACIKLLPPVDRQAWCNFTGDPVCDVNPPYVFHETSCESQVVNNVTTFINKWKTIHINSNNARYECTIHLKHGCSYANSSVSYFHSIAPDVSQSNIHAFTMKARLANGTDMNVWGEVSCKVIACCDGSGITAGDDQQICKGDSIMLAAAGGISYSWLPVTGLSNPNIANPFASPIVTTNYTVTISKANCSLTFTDIVTVEVLDKPIANAGSDQTICEGGAANLLATGGSVFEWTPIDGLSDPNIANPEAEPAVTTTYTVTIAGTDICPIKNTDEITVFVNKRPVITTGGNVVACNNEPVQISATSLGATSYSWVPAGTLNSAIINNPMANPPVTTTYTVTVMNANNCMSKATVKVTKGGTDDGSVSPTQTICLGDSVQLEASGGMSYEWWSPADDLSCTTCSNPEAKPTTTTTYEVNITTLTGCVVKRTVTVIVNPGLSLTLTSSKTDVCVYDTVNLFASGAKEYHWEPAEDLTCETCASPSFIASKTTTYTVTAFDDKCSATDSITVTVDPAQNADFITRVINCSALFVAVPEGMISYEWDLGDGTIRTEQSFEYSYARSGNYVVRLTVTGSCGKTDVFKVVEITKCNDQCN